MLFCTVIFVRVFLQCTNKWYSFKKRINHTLKTDTRKTFCVIFKKVHLILKNLVEQRTSHTYERTIRMNEKRRIQQQCFKFHFVYFFSSFFHLAQARPCDCVLTNGCDCVCMHTASSVQHSTAQHSTVSVRLLESLESCVFLWRRDEWN